MISFDHDHKQILSSECKNCCDPYFQPADLSFPNVGCCSYSPVFTLFELNQFIANGEEDFFRQTIYANHDATILDFEIIVHAEVHKAFFLRDLSSLAKLEREDLKLGYSVCQFFKHRAGCQLHPVYKNVTCRSFICMTIEQSLTDIEQKNFLQNANSFQKEVTAFNQRYIKLFQANGWSFKNHLEEIIAHFKQKFE